MAKNSTAIVITAAFTLAKKWKKVVEIYYYYSLYQTSSSPCV
jgi:hypothetical protein